MALESDLQSQYDKLTQEIRKNIDEQDAKFIEMSQSNYGGDYDGDKTEYQIDKKIEDINNTRNSIWNYLKKQYNDNTRDRNINFKVLSQKKRTLNKQTNEIKKLNQLRDEVNTEKNTNNRKIQHHKYITDRYNYYFFLYKVIASAIVLSILLLTSVIYGYLPKKMGLMLTGVVFLCLVIYIFYYTIILNYNRDKFDWDAYYYKGGEAPKRKKECVPVVTAEEEELNELREKATNKIKEITTPKKCSNKSK